MCGFKQDETFMNGQTSINFNITRARERRDDGIVRAMDHADSVERGWCDMAYDFLVNVFIKHHKGPFQVEDVRASCAGVVPEAPSARAWGGIILRARHAGLIQKVGTEAVRNPKANCAIATVWQRI